MSNAEQHFDVIVVGSGATGSIAVKELTERGLNVLLLEAGRDITAADFVPPAPTPPKAMSINLWGRARAMLAGQIVQSRRAMFKEQTSPFLVNDLKQPYATKDGDFLWIRGQQLGGRLHSYGRVLLRASDEEFKGKDLGHGGENWPIAYKDLAPYYDSVEKFLGVYGSKDGIASLPDGKYCGRSELNSAEKNFKNVVEARWPDRKTIPWRYAAPNLDRVPMGIIAARKTGKLTERVNAVVARVNVDETTGKATGVTYIDRLNKTKHTATAEVVMLCASAIESVRLLLNSASEKHPGGLGNSSGLLGKYFMDQTPSLLFGDDPNFPGSEVPAPAPEDPYYGQAGGVYIPKFDNVNGKVNKNYRYGWAVQGTIGRMPVPEGHPGTVGLMAFGEMPAYKENTVTLHKWRKDAWGIPIPKIRLAITDNERAIMKAQVAGLREMAEAAGYKVNFAGSALGLDSYKVWPKADPFSRLLFILAFKKSMAMGAAIHECGGARMGDDPKNSVLNKDNQLWDVPNVYVTDAAAYVSNGSVGPTLTIMALTARAAEHVAKNFKKGKK